MQDKTHLQDSDGDDDDVQNDVDGPDDSDDDENDAQGIPDEESDHNTRHHALNATKVTHETRPVKMDNVVSGDEYENDSSDEEDIRNTIGNIPVEWYNDYPHIGYDWSGDQIIKPKKRDEVENFMRRIEDENYWRTVEDHMTGQNVILTDADASLIKRLGKGHFPDPSYNPYEDMVDFFTYEKMIHPVTNRPETKASFIPSIGEKRKISKLVSKIKRSWQNPKIEKKKDAPYQFNYDLWEKDAGPLSKRQEARRSHYIPAPKMQLPGHEESYNPPPEYLLTDDEKKKLLEKEEAKDPEDQNLNPFIPQKYQNLRSVPGYADFVKERFERCLDLYLCPRIRKMRANVNPEDLIPRLPKPKDLQPFPTIQAIVYMGHEDVITSISVDPKAQFIVSGSDDKTVRVWEINTGRCFKRFDFEASVQFVVWYPNSQKSLVAVASGKDIILINPGVGEKSLVTSTDDFFREESENNPESDAGIAKWTIVDEKSEEWQKGWRVVIRHKFEVKQICWQTRGDYFAGLMPTGGNKSVVIHQLSKRRSQVPFSKSKGIIQRILFHPTRPYFCVATQRYVRIYNLMKQQLNKKLMSGCRIISSMAIHPAGDNIILGSFDARLPWFDLDLSTKPYKTMRYHKKSIRQVAFHPKYPLFASASDDGSVIVSHGMVYR